MTMTHFGPVGLRGAVDSAPRVHAVNQFWGPMAGFASDFWFYPQADVITSSTPGLLVDNGWTSNGTLTVTEGSAADFLSNADMGVFPHVLLDASGDYLMSPVCFGQFNAFRRQILGFEPTKLIAEFYAAFTTASNNETASGLGFTEDGGAITTANDALAVIFSDGTNFKLRSGAATSAAGPVIDTAWHLWKIVIQADGVYWYVDGVGQGSIALEADEFPVSFGAGVVTNNDLAMGPAHVYYAA